MKIMIQCIICFLLMISCDKKISTQPSLYQDKLYNKYMPIMRKYLEKKGYKYPDQDTFERKILEYFGENIRDSTFDDVYLKKGKGLYALRNEKFIDTYQLDRGELDEIGDAFESILEESYQQGYDGEFILYNKILFNDDISSITQILHDKKMVEDIVIYFDYEKNPLLMKYAAKEIDYKNNKENFQYLEHILFYNNRNRNSVVRKELLSLILNFDSDIVISLGYSLLYDQSKYIGVIQKHKDEALAYILDIVLQKEDPIEDFQHNETYRLLNNCYVADINILERFKKNKFYGYKYLEEYTEQFLLSEEDFIQPLTYIIQDPDGYTNLRKEKNAHSEILQRINTGDQVEVLDNTGDWFFVKTKEGKTGYVHKSRVKK